MVTSSAVVGSSAISMSGSLASAMAIMTRWRCPPRIHADTPSCAARDAEYGTRLRSRIASVCASAPLNPRALRIGSISWGLLIE